MFRKKFKNNVKTELKRKNKKYDNMKNLITTTIQIDDELYEKL